MPTLGHVFSNTAAENGVGTAAGGPRDPRSATALLGRRWDGALRGARAAACTRLATTLLKLHWDGVAGVGSGGDETVRQLTRATRLPQGSVQDNEAQQRHVPT